MLQISTETDVNATQFSICELNSKPYLNIQTQLSEEPALITITDITGRIVYQSAFSNRIDVSHLPKGMYVLSVQTKEGQFNQKVIVQ